MKRLVNLTCFGLMFFLGTMAHAQLDVEIDSLKRSLPAIDNDSSRVVILNKIGERYIYQNPDSAQRYLDQAIRVGKAARLKSPLADAFLLTGIRLEGVSQYDSAVVYNQKALQIFEQLKDSVSMGNALSNLGLVSEAQGKKQVGIDYHLKALDLFLLTNDSLGIAKTYNNLGILFKTIKDYPRASDYYQKAADIFKAMKYPFGQAALLNNAASVQLEYAAYDSALVNARKALVIYKAEGIEQYQPSALEVIGTALLNTGKYSDALDTLSLALQLYRKYDNKKERSLVARRMAECYLKLGDLSSAKQQADSSLYLALTVNTFNEISEAARVLAEVTSKLGDYPAAYDHLKLHKAYADSVLTSENLETINELEARYDKEFQDREIAEQNLVIAQRDASIQRQRFQIGSLLAGLIIVILSGLIFYRQRQNKQQAELQAAVIREKERGLEAVFEATETERKRIAKDLHDGVGQQLSAIKRGFETFASNLSESAGNKLSQLQALIDETAQETRSISHQMMPRALTELGLVPAIEDALNKSFGPSAIGFSFEYFNLKDRYPERKEIALYRIAQELINNIIKHSGANEVQVQLFETQSKLMLVVQDNGKGFSAGNNNGHGLLNIRNRLQPFRGKLNLESDQSGTVATITIPV